MCHNLWIYNSDLDTPVVDSLGVRQGLKKLHNYNEKWDVPEKTDS